METTLTIDVIVVGAGFGGVMSLHELRQKGYNVKIVEAGPDFGGVWLFNKYPGARVDSELPSYQLSTKAAWKDFTFSELYPGRDELCKYFAHLDKTLDLRKDTIFNQKIIEAKYDDESNTWTLLSNTGLTLKSRFVVFAAGTTHKPHVPKFPDVDKFKGQVIHPSNWPSDLDVCGKKVAIIGQGASGVQIVQELAKEQCELTVYVRNPCITLPMRQRLISKDEAEAQKDIYGPIFHTMKYDTVGYPYTNGPSYFDVTEEERQELYHELWEKGGFGVAVRNFQELQLDKEANISFYKFWVEQVRKRLTDPEKQDIVAPLEQCYWVGTKRPSLEQDYYEMLNRPNVKLINLRKAKLEKFVQDGIVTTTSDGSTGSTSETRQFDIVICSTGYDAVTASIYDLNIHDKNGLRLQEKWKDGIITHLGLMVPDMPNAFFLYGPQAPTSFTSAPSFLELEIEWMLTIFDKLKHGNLTKIVPTQEASETWRAKNAACLEKVLHRETASWWTGENIPGKRRESLLWIGGQGSWWKECEADLKDLSNYHVQ